MGNSSFVLSLLWKLITEPHAEPVPKLSIVVEEAEETLLWLELFVEANIVNEATSQPLYKEAQELLYIFSSSRKTVKNNLKAKKSSHLQSSDQPITKSTNEPINKSLNHPVNK